MNLEAIGELFAYNQWANHKVLDASRVVSADDFVRDLGSSHRSLRGTFVHALWAEWIWLQRWNGRSPKDVFLEEEFPDLPAIASRWVDVEEAQEQLIVGLTEERLQARIAYENMQGIRWEYSLAHMMQHVANHASYHRGQAVTLLRQLGHRAPTTDFLVFFDERDLSRE